MQMNWPLTIFIVVGVAIVLWAWWKSNQIGKDQERVENRRMRQMRLETRLIDICQRLWRLERDSKDIKIRLIEIQESLLKLQETPEDRARADLFNQDLYTPWTQYLRDLEANLKQQVRDILRGPRKESAKPSGKSSSPKAEKPQSSTD